MPKYLKCIFSLALEQKRSMFLLVVFLLISVGARLTEPYLYKVVVDTLTTGLINRIFLDSQIRTLVIVVIFWFLLAVIMNFTGARASHLSWYIGNRSSQKMHLSGYRRLLRMDYSKHAARHSSRLVKIVDDADVSTWEMTNWWLGRFFSAILGFVGMLFIALSISWQMTLIAVSVIPPTLWFIARHVKKYEDEQKRVNRLWEEKHEHLADQVLNIVTYKLNPHEEIFMERQKKYSDTAVEAQLELNKRWRIAETLNPDAFARFLVLGTGIFFVQNGSITLGTLFMFMGLLNEILVPLHLLGDILPQYSRRAQQIERLISLMSEKDGVVQSAEPAEVSCVKGNIAFDNVSFFYSNNEKDSFRIKNISFEIDAGETVAIVGHSGSGKTTIMMLLTRLVDTTGGAIRIDGTDIKNFRAEEIKKHIGTVLQENAMYNETVAENIAYGDPGASRERIISAAKQAHAHEFIGKLKNEYDTLIGERGIRLSGGEKQRMAIARAILKNPQIVVLDEPTSALDSITEKKVQQGINMLMKGRTTLIIAHRLSTVRHADKIIVLDNGKIIGIGPHPELMKKCPTYKKMVDLQTEGFLADRP
ncbi:MAG: ABC transporter ATP-binding protein [Candidatus Liptonbacteria bacterium]|nr:ABC transporter ATP-binding protein [Candidatus Liptonbacteria bacterium]